MDFAAFAAELRGKKGPAPVYVIAGPESLLRNRAAALLAESDPELGANLIRLASSETDWARVADELYTPPFLAKKKLVVLVDEGNFVHNHAEALRGYLKQPSASNVLAALVPTEKVPALAGAVLVECRSLKPGDLQRWLASEAQRLGKPLDRAAGELLAARAGANLSALSGHLEKLAAHAGARPSISAEDVRALVGYQEEREVYELSLAAAAKDVAKAYRVLRALLNSGEAVQVLLWKLAWQYRKLAEAKKLLAAGRRRFEVTSQLQITYYADEFLKLVDGHSLVELVDKHGEILKADVALKTSGGNEVPVLESLVCRLASPAAR
ncbi:MAG TPA: DNA polymerase III subunit delta [Planctomycetota bacterium]|jgi:DNA polymerase III subunit delta|nr:DNA polymerase III subunit delta [Planctomycetota bacterium]